MMINDKTVKMVAKFLASTGAGVVTSNTLSFTTPYTRDVVIKGLHLIGRLVFSGIAAIEVGKYTGKMFDEAKDKYSKRKE